jgi:hypothetical protein
MSTHINLPLPGTRVQETSAKHQPFDPEVSVDKSVLFCTFLLADADEGVVFGQFHAAGLLAAETTMSLAWMASQLHAGQLQQRVEPVEENKRCKK